MAAKQKMDSVNIYIDDSLSQEGTHFSGKPQILHSLGLVAVHLSWGLCSAT